MYSPTARLLTVLELLQSYKKMSGPEIAHRLEIDVRTVRRYITMLQDMGIPVEAERGPYGAYQLKRGHRLPPLMFTDAEAVALVLSLLTIREFRFPVGVAAVEGALAKTERVLPQKLLEQTRGLQESIVFNVTPPPVQPENDFLVALSWAVQQGQRVHLRYRAWGNSESQREFDPYGIVYNEGYWYTTGYCHMRRDLRIFRVDRIVALDTLEKFFERPENFDALKHVMSVVTSTPVAEQVEVVLKTTLERAQKVISPMMGTLEPSEKGIIFRRPTTHLEWVAHVLLSLDFPVLVVQPVELREVLRQMAARALQMAEDDR